MPVYCTAVSLSELLVALFRSDGEDGRVLAEAWAVLLGASGRGLQFTF